MHSQSVVDYATKSKGANDYEMLVEEIIKRLTLSSVKLVRSDSNLVKRLDTWPVAIFDPKKMLHFTNIISSPKINLSTFRDSSVKFDLDSPIYIPQTEKEAIKEFKKSSQSTYALSVFASSGLNFAHQFAFGCLQTLNGSWPNFS